MKVISFKVDEELLELIEEYARRKNITKSEFIRRAITRYIKQQDDKPIVTKRLVIY